MMFNDTRLSIEVRVFGGDLMSGFVGDNDVDGRHCTLLLSVKSFSIRGDMRLVVG